MPAGRPPSGAALVAGLEGSLGAKRRLRLVLETLGGKKTVAEACEELGIGQTAFYKFRSLWLAEALSLLEPKPRGRPRKPAPAVEQEELERLREENAALRRALRLGAVREELAVAMPWVLARKEREEKKTRPRRPRPPRQRS